MRKCRTCNELKDHSNFDIIRSTYKGVKSDIKYEHLRLDCKECAYRKKFEKFLKSAYNLTVTEYQKMIMDQNNKCAICKTVFENTPYVDHCHSTGKVRGLLCAKCNFGLGHFNDNVDLLSQAIEYLKA